MIKRGFCQTYLFCDFYKAEKNKTPNEKLFESYLGSTPQREGGNMKARNGRVHG